MCEEWVIVLVGLGDGGVGGLWEVILELLGGGGYG